MERALLFSLLLTAAAIDAERFLCILGSFRCEDGGQVPLCQRCDEKRDCGDGSDERGCRAANVSCGPRGRRCGSDGPCLPLERICDGHGDCPDNSDESLDACGHRVDTTSPACPKDEFQCEPGAECFPLAFVCDGHSDCPDERDERGCLLDFPTVSVTPPATQTDGVPVPGNAMPADLVVLSIIAFLAVVVAAVFASAWSRAKARHLASFKWDHGSEQLIAKQQP
uniref:CD320 antigen isoform X1 n=1 Tax=Podarcis muralis TaxID=64176 RepID=UPI00109F957D|nr:CD320 antigen isoform X1 [Podarcis muralis]